MRQNRKRWGGILCALAVAATPLDVYAATVTLGASKDNTLYENATGALSNGSGDGFFVGKTNIDNGSVSRGVIAFDLSPVPTNAQVSSATLTLTSIRAILNTTVDLHRASKNWGQGASNAISSGGG